MKARLKMRIEWLIDCWKYGWTTYSIYKELVKNKK